MAQILFRAAYLEVPHQLGSGNRLAAAPGIAQIGIENRQPFRGREVNFEALNLKPRSPQAALSILKPTQHRQDHAGRTCICEKSSIPRAHDNYRVVLKLDEGEFEIGSIGIQHGAAWS
jgi:hypothetical protein